MKDGGGGPSALWGGVGEWERERAARRCPPNPHGEVVCVCVGGGGGGGAIWLAAEASGGGSGEEEGKMSERPAD